MALMLAPSGPSALSELDSVKPLCSHTSGLVGSGHRKQVRHCCNGQVGHAQAFPAPSMAWVAAWGKGAAAAVNAAPLRDGDEECVICFERAVQVNFRPCKHGACHACVDKLRAANIFKARSALRGSCWA